MVSIGIDVGSQYVKAMIWDGNEVISKASIQGGKESSSTGKEALEKILKEAGLSRDQVGHIAATGVGKDYIEETDITATDIKCGVLGSIHLFSSARTIIDIGAEGCHVINCNKEGKVIRSVFNDKCASGTGIFLDTIAEVLKVSVEELGELSSHSKEQIEMNLSCAVFAESEVVSFIHKGINKADIIWAVHDAIAKRTISLMERVGIEDDIVLIGGVAKNKGMVEAIKQRVGRPIKVPEDPEYVNALGAAIFAERRGEA
ncbi:MAG: hypothetical protein JRH06_14940 [Deltaproteobacteria bacterium]|nr:hypothetical protein [Deltaproteobacteria bacterium]